MKQCTQSPATTGLVVTYSKSSPTPQVFFSRNSVLRSYLCTPCTCIFFNAFQIPRREHAQLPFPFASPPEATASSRRALLARQSTRKMCVPAPRACIPCVVLSVFCMRIVVSVFSMALHSFRLPRTVLFYSRIRFRFRCSIRARQIEHEI